MTRFRDPFARASAAVGGAEPIHVLVHSRRLATDREVESFESALGALPAQLGEADIVRLLDGFDDDTDHPEVTFGLVHRLDDTPSPRYEQAILAGLPHLLVTAPWWAEVLIIRILNSDSSRPTMIGLAKSSAPEQRETLRSLCDGIAAGGNEVAGRAQATIDLLWPSDAATRSDGS